MIIQTTQFTHQNYPVDSVAFPIHFVSSESIHHALVQLHMISCTPALV